MKWINSSYIGCGWRNLRQTQGWGQPALTPVNTRGYTGGGGMLVMAVHPTFFTFLIPKAHLSQLYFQSNVAYAYNTAQMKFCSCSFYICVFERSHMRMREHSFTNHPQNHEQHGRDASRAIVLNEFDWLVHTYLPFVIKTFFELFMQSPNAKGAKIKKNVYMFAYI